MKYIKASASRDVTETVIRSQLNRWPHEKLRQEFVSKIAKITNLPIDEISVEVSLTSFDEGSLAIEAKKLNWFSDRYKESIWYIKSAKIICRTNIEKR